MNDLATSVATPEASVHRERPPRLDCCLHAEVESADGFAAMVTVRNISLGGMRAEGNHLLNDGDAITISLHDLGEIAGQVVWAQPGAFGVQFQLPINPVLARKINAQNSRR